MRLLVTRMAVAIATLLFSSLVALPAQADAYWDGVARGFTDTHVWQDGNVHVMSAGQIESLKQQINASGKPIYVAVVDQSRAGSSTADYPDSLYGALHKSGVMLVVGAKTFRASAFDTSEEVALHTPGIATRVVDTAKKERAAKTPDYQMISSFITEVSQLNFIIAGNPAAGPEQESPVSNDSGSSWMWWVLLIAASMLIGAFVIWYFKDKARMAKERKDNDERLRQYTEPAYEASRPDPTVDRTSAYTAYDEDNLPHLVPSVAEEHQPTRPVKPRSPKKAKSSRGRGKNNYRNHYSSRPSETHTHYYAGGAGYPAGYYADPFWNAFLLSQLIDANDGSYSQGYQDGERHAENATSTQSYTSSSDKSDDSVSNASTAYSSGYSGGGDFSSNDSEENTSAYVAPVYTPAPSYDPPSYSSSSSDTSYSSPSYDSGGGSYDSGSSGGGDF